MKGREIFVHLHVHSDMSSLDGCARISDYAKTAAERGNPALALTDHGTMRGLFMLTEECKKRRIDPIYGVELYVCPDMARKGLTDEEKAQAIEGEESKTAQREKIRALEKELGIRRTFHLTAWALNQEGLRNLYRLTSKGWGDGFYYRPRVDLDAIIEHNAGVAIATGCVNSMVYAQVLDGRPREADVVFGRLSEAFGDRLYLEVMPHNLKDQKQQRANRHALLLREVSNHKLIATQDSHYLRAGDATPHDILLAVGAHKTLGDPDRFRFDSNEFWFKTREEMDESFKTAHPYLTEEQRNEALDSTVELAERCAAKIEINPHKCLLPPVTLPEGYDSEWAYIAYLVSCGLSKRKIPDRAERVALREGSDPEEVFVRYYQRAKRELLVLRESGFAAYFLILYDMYEWARSQGIACGPGRGSAAGSLVSYLLGITDVDPIEHRLMFERFISPGRINMPDIDCDFEDARRGEILGYLREKYGRDRVAQISTMGRMAGRQALKDVARVFDVPYQRASIAASAVSIDGSNGALAEAAKQSSVFRTFEEEYPRATKNAIALEGLMKSSGVHPAGVVTSPVPLVDVVPLETRRVAGEELILTAYDMRGVEGIGLLKIDILGLKTITVLYDALRAVNERTGGELEFAEVELDDRETLEGFTNRDFVGIFQFDSPHARNVSDGLTFTCFDDLVAINAINRPGAVEFADEFKRRKANPALTKRHVYHPKVSEITSNALGLMIYQEHVIRVATDVAGFTPAAADKLRKKIGKSEGVAALETERHKFVEGCRGTTPDMDRDTAEKLFDSIAKFGRYGFNRSHAVCYSLLAYWGMWLKKHHALEFYWATMKRESDQDKIVRFARDAKEHSVELLLPDVNVSGAGFALDYQANAVRGSLTEIKGLGVAAVNAVVKAREKKGAFKDLVDFLVRARGRNVTKKTVEALAKSGALDSLLPNPRWFVTQMKKDFWKHIERGKMEQIRMAVESSARLAQWDEEQRLIVAAEVNPLATPPHPLVAWESWLVNNIKAELHSITEELMAETQNVYVTGVVTEYEERYVGDTKAIEDAPDRATMKIIGWGEKWVRLTVEGIGGSYSWAKIDWSQVNIFQDVLERGVGALVVICARTRPDWRNLDVHFIADLECIASKLKEERTEDLTIWERLFVDEHHPADCYPWGSKADRRLAKRNPEEVAEAASDSFSVIGVVSHLFLRNDKHNRTMAFFGVAGLHGYINVICFASAWEDYRGYVKSGSFARFKLRKLEDGTCSLESRRDGVHLLEKPLIVKGG